jgi:hypothetical protein
MDSNEIKRNITAQIAIVNRSFSKVGPIWIKDPMKEDIVSLERNLKTNTLYFKFYMVGAIILAGILFVISLLKTFKMLENLDLNNGGLMILFTIVFGLNAFAYYKVKVNLENKIYLLKLLKSID